MTDKVIPNRKNSGNMYLIGEKCNLLYTFDPHILNVTFVFLENPCSRNNTVVKILKNGRTVVYFLAFKQRQNLVCM